MIVTAWNNGTHSRTGAGYGLKVATKDRDEHFNRAWSSVAIILPGGAEARVNIDKESFWGPDCRELIHKDVGRWLLKSGLAPWGRGHPPRLHLEPAGDGPFELKP